MREAISIKGGADIDQYKLYQQYPCYPANDNGNATTLDDGLLFIHKKVAVCPQIAQILPVLGGWPPPVVISGSASDLFRYIQLLHDRTG